MRREDLGELVQQPRFQRHMDLEDAIIKHAPDAIECQELLACLRMALERRYELKATKALELFDDLNDKLADLQDSGEPEPFDNQDGL